MATSALIIFLGSIGFGCLPPPDSEPVARPYSGPFVMPIGEAQSFVDDFTANNQASKGEVYLLPDSDPSFAETVKRCPTIY